jgi:hypothetical protein
LFRISFGRLFDAMLESAPAAEDDASAFVERSSAAVKRTRPLRSEAGLLFVISWG